MWEEKYHKYDCKTEYDQKMIKSNQCTYYGSSLHGIVRIWVNPDLEIRTTKQSPSYIKTQKKTL